MKPSKTKISCTVHAKGTLFFRSVIGKAENEKTGAVYQLTQQVVDGSPVVELPDGRLVTFGWQALIDAAVAAAKGAS